MPDPEGKNPNTFSPVKIKICNAHRAILVKFFETQSFHQAFMLSANTDNTDIDKTFSNLIMCKMPEITKRPLQHHSNMRAELFFPLQFFPCFMLYFSSSQIIYSDLKCIVYVFINAVEHWETPVNSFMGVQGRSDKEMKKRSIAISTVFLHYIGHSDFFQNP